MTDKGWAVDWDAITTPGSLLLLMTTQLTPQVEIAIRAGTALLAGEGEKIQNVSAFLASASSAASFLWPSPMRHRELREAFPNRAADLRHVLGVADEEPAALDKIRNDLIHIDERLEKLYLANPNLSLMAWGASSKAATGTKILMSFDPATGVLHSLDEEVNVKELVEWLIDLRKRLGRMFMPLLVKSPHIGGSA